MIKQEMTDGLNKQINEELFSSYLYASMVTYFEDVNMPGFASWMRVQAAEELEHAKKIIEFLFERGARVKLDAIAAPQTEWESPLAAFQAAYKHECHISECIDKLSSLSLKLDDHASRVFLEWYVTEQVEEEANATKMVQELSLVGDKGHGLLMLDREAGQRQFVPPAPAAE